MESTLSTGRVAELILAGASFSELFARGVAASEVFSALVRLELSAHSNMPTRHRVSRVDDHQVNHAFEAAANAARCAYKTAA